MKKQQQRKTAEQRHAERTAETEAIVAKYRAEMTALILEEAAALRRELFADKAEVKNDV